MRYRGIRRCWLPEDGRQDLVELVGAGYVERDPGLAGLYKLTVKGQKALDDRGVGANEQRLGMGREAFSDQQPAPVQQ